MQPTFLKYLEDFTLLLDTATVSDIIQEQEKYIVILNQTIFYPQGGGQPYDVGIIENEKGRFVVEQVRFVDGLVKHIGTFEQGMFSKNDVVHCTIDQRRRELHSRLHSAGHVIDMAITSLKLPLVPTKGYHFPDGPYIEYTGTIENQDKEALKINLENVCNKIIQENRQTKLLFMNKEEMKKICHHVPDYLPAGKPARVVMYGDFGIPCGGTHVSNLGDIRQMFIRKIKQSGPTIRISYDIIRDL